MPVEKMLQNLRHVRIGCVNLVDDQKTATERTAPQMRMLHLESREHRLIHGSDGDCRGQEPRRVFRRPSLRSGRRIVVPLDAPMGQTLAGEFSRAQHARDRQHGFRRGCGEYPA